MQAISEAAEYTLQFINQTQRSIFLTGKRVLKDHAVAGNYRDHAEYRCGRARNCCLNAGGVTIHSMFQLPFGGFIPAFNVESQFTETVKFESKDTWRHFKMGGLKKSVIRNMELLIIDEVVCFADLLDAMDYMMQTVRKKTTLSVGFRFCLSVIYYSCLQLFGMKRRTLLAYYKEILFSFACGAAKSTIY
jgi:hypothetical protein